MSFSSDCKKELCLVPPEKSCCELSELCGLYASIGSLSLLGRGQVNAQFTSESMAVSRRIYTLLANALHIAPQIHYVTSSRFGGTRKCVLTLGPINSPRLLCALGMMDKTDDGYAFRSATPKLSLTRGCCMRAYLRGVFLGGGTMTSPEQGYHLELGCRDGEMRAQIAKCLQKADITIRQSSRKDKHFFYIKQVEQITAFLTTIGAHQSVMYIEDLRVKRQVYSGVTRAFNCDNANLEKQTATGNRQAHALRKLHREGKLQALPEALQQMAMLRMEHPDASLSELGALMDPPIGKSGVNHRMRRLMAYIDNESAQHTGGKDE